MPTQRSETSTQPAGLSADAVRLAALEREIRRLKAIVLRQRRAYHDLEIELNPPGAVEDLEEELDDFDEDELGIDPEEGL